MAGSENRAGDQPQDCENTSLTFPITLLGRADEVIEFETVQLPGGTIPPHDGNGPVPAASRMHIVISA